jgi:Xaa-Pro dipeptidase
MTDRLETVYRSVRDAGLEALVVSTPANTYYLTGFRAVTYSRPVVVVLTASPVLVIPELEAAHAQARSRVREIRAYADTALGGLTGKHPLHLALDLTIEVLRSQEVRGPVGFEAGGLTFEGYAYLREHAPWELQPTRRLVEAPRMVKDAGELELIRRGCLLAEHGMAVEVDASQAGAAEVAIMAEGNAAMLREAARRFPDDEVSASSRPVSGEKTVLPHSIPSGRRLRPGDVVIHGTGCVVEGYHSEDERTIVVGEPTAEQRRLFELMVRAQQAAVEAIRPGRPCREVDRAARSVIEAAGFGRQFIHRTGHGIGIDIHEAPYFSAGDETVLQPGMVMSVEPGIYVEGVGGFRHSDTVVVTEDGCRVLTSFPRTLGALVVP